MTTVTKWQVRECITWCTGAVAQIGAAVWSSGSGIRMHLNWNASIKYTSSTGALWAVCWAVRAHGSAQTGGMTLRLNPFWQLASLRNAMRDFYKMRQQTKTTTSQPLWAETVQRPRVGVRVKAVQTAIISASWSHHWPVLHDRGWAHMDVPAEEASRYREHSRNTGQTRRERSVNPLKEAE